MDRLTGFQLFDRVVETGGFSRAASNLRLTQPTVTTHVLAMELELGVRLLNHNSLQNSCTIESREASQVVVNSVDCNFNNATLRMAVSVAWSHAGHAVGRRSAGSSRVALAWPQAACPAL